MMLVTTNAVWRVSVGYLCLGLVLTALYEMQNVKWTENLELFIALEYSHCVCANLSAQFSFLECAVPFVTFVTFRLRNMLPELPRFSKTVVKVFAHQWIHHCWSYLLEKMLLIAVLNFVLGHPSLMNSFFLQKSHENIAYYSLAAFQRSQNLSEFSELRLAAEQPALSAPARQKGSILSA